MSESFNFKAGMIPDSVILADDLGIFECDWRAPLDRWAFLDELENESRLLHLLDRDGIQPDFKSVRSNLLIFWRKLILSWHDTLNSKLMLPHLQGVAKKWLNENKL